MARREHLAAYLSGVARRRRQTLRATDPGTPPWALTAGGAGKVYVDELLRVTFEADGVAACTASKAFVVEAGALYELACETSKTGFSLSVGASAGTDDVVSKMAPTRTDVSGVFFVAPGDVVYVTFERTAAGKAKVRSLSLRRV